MLSLRSPSLKRKHVEGWSELKRMTSNPTPTKLFYARPIIVPGFSLHPVIARATGKNAVWNLMWIYMLSTRSKIILIVLLALCYVNQSTIHHATFLAKIESSFPKVLTRIVFFLFFLRKSHHWSSCPYRWQTNRREERFECSSVGGTRSHCWTYLYHCPGVLYS